MIGLNLLRLGKAYLLGYEPIPVIGKRERVFLGTDQSATINPVALKKMIAKQTPSLLGYRERLSALVSEAKAFGSLPDLITQPILFGDGRDPRTGKYVTTRLGRIIWKRLQLYNEVTRSVAREADVFLIDLAVSLPKDTAFFYDYMHFTNEAQPRYAK
jgi:hypothetical protein